MRTNNASGHLQTQPTKPMRYRLRRTAYRLLACFLASFLPGEVLGQTAYANPSVGRPFETEDARPLDRFAVEGYIAPATFRRSTGTSSWSVVPGISLGLAPRTQVDVVVPFTVPGSGEAGVTGAGLSILYSLNVETRGLPAFAVRGGVLMPVGDNGARNAHESLTGIVSRSFGWGRLHLNHRYTFGSETAPIAQVVKLSRWRSALAADHVFAMQGLLIGAEVAASQPIVGLVDPIWELRGATRYQLTRSTIVEASVGRSFADDEQWSISVGAEFNWAHFSMLPGLGRWDR